MSVFRAIYGLNFDATRRVQKWKGVDSGCEREWTLEKYLGVVVL